MGHCRLLQAQRIRKLQQVGRAHLLERASTFRMVGPWLAAELGPHLLERTLERGLERETLERHLEREPWSAEVGAWVLEREVGAQKLERGTWGGMGWGAENAFEPTPARP